MKQHSRNVKIILTTVAVLTVGVPAAPGAARATGGVDAGDGVLERLAVRSTGSGELDGALERLASRSTATADDYQGATERLAARLPSTAGDTHVIALGTTCHEDELHAE